MTDEHTPHVETLELINDELSARLVRQSESGARIDTKSVVILGFAATGAQFLATRNVQWAFAIVAYAGYALAFGFGVGAMGVARYRDAPKPRGLFNGYVMKTKQETLLRLAAKRVDVFEKNERKHERKAARWYISTACLAVAIVFSIIAILTQNGSHDGRFEHTGTCKPTSQSCGDATG